MAQSVTLWGASYSNVPAINVPKTGGGTARFTDTSDTTAVAADVASGKIFFDSSGAQQTGTASGGGASNFVSGEFTVGGTTGTVGTVTIPYTGSGYPIAGIIVVKGGIYNNNSTTGSPAWYNLIQRYAVGLFMFSKRNRTVPGFTTGSSNADSVVSSWAYKSSTSSSTMYSVTGRDAQMFRASSIDPSATGQDCVKFVGNSKTLKYYVASTSYGLASGITYEYQIIYSS